MEANAGQQTDETASANATSQDPRVGANIRLGNDPSALPPNQRAQAEPHIARSPVNVDYLIATFQEGRFADANGQAVNCGYSVSRDGGFTWTRALIPNLTPSSAGSYPRATDPVAGVGLNGNAFLNTLSAGNATQGGSVLVSRSVNGSNFNAPRVAYHANNPNDFPDKNWMAVNTFANTPTAGRIVVTFTLFQNGGNDPAAPHPIMRVYSDNNGDTWSSAAFVHAGTKQVQGSQPVFLPDGKLAIVYWNFNNTTSMADDFLELVVSPDGGVTFGAPKQITAVPFYDTPSIRDGGFLPSATVDRTTGALLVTYQALFNGSPKIMFTKSTNAGTTWTTPVPVSDNPGTAGVFNPAISASADGKRLAISFYDKRDNPGSQTMVDLYVAYSLNAGMSWQPNLRVSSTSTNATLSPLTAGGYMLGDYLGIAEPTNTSVPAVPVWIDSRTGNPDPFTARVSIVPSATMGKADFNHDGHADLIWRNRLDGRNSIWFMKAGVFQGSRSLPTIPTQWRIASTADFNGDGHSDLVWENLNTGERVIWFLQNGTFKRDIGLGTVALEWKIAGAADFDGDGHGDLVWQNSSTGARHIWFLRDGVLQRSLSVATVNTQWQIAGAADFNADGYSDLAWQNVGTGQRVLWFLRRGALQSSRSLQTVGRDWQIAGAGDFDKDGQSDLVWQRTNTGDRVIWFLSNGSYQRATTFTKIATDWEIANH